MQINASTHWIHIKLIPNFVPDHEFTFICFYLCQISRQSECVLKKLQQFLQVCKKNNLSPPIPEEKKNEEKNTED